MTAIDTTGAGDCFVGVLAAALSRGATLPEAMRRAAVAGSLACTIVGAMPSFPTRPPDRCGPGAGGADSSEGKGHEQDQILSTAIPGTTTPSRSCSRREPDIWISSASRPCTATTRSRTPRVNALTILELAGLDVPLARSADPLAREPKVAVAVHGKSGLDGADLPDPTRRPSTRTPWTSSSTCAPPDIAAS